MRLLVDAHVLLWATVSSALLNEAARKALDDSDNEVFVSVTTAWELAIKSNIGKLTLPPQFFELVEQAGYEFLPLSLDHIQHYRSLPLHHRDPFDRILVSQAFCEGLTLVTRDPLFEPYGVSTIKA